MFLFFFQWSDLFQIIYQYEFLTLLLIHSVFLRSVAFFFTSVFKFRAKLRERHRGFTLPSIPYAQPSLLFTSPTKGVHLLQLINLHWHIIVTQSPYFMLWLILDAVPSMGLDRFTMRYIQVLYVFFFFLKNKTWLIFPR